MLTNWLGLWAQERQGFYAGQVIKKSDITDFTHIIVRYNKFYEKCSNRPRFIYCFADSNGYEQKCVPIEKNSKYAYYDNDAECFFDEDGSRLFTRDEVRAIINGTVSDVEYGIHDPFDILPEDFI